MIMPLTAEFIDKADAYGLNPCVYFADKNVILFRNTRVEEVNYFLREELFEDRSHVISIESEGILIVFSDRAQSARNYNPHIN